MCRMLSKSMRLRGARKSERSTSGYKPYSGCIRLSSGAKGPSEKRQPDLPHAWLRDSFGGVKTPPASPPEIVSAEAPPTNASGEPVATPTEDELSETQLESVAGGSQAPRRVERDSAARPVVALGTPGCLDGPD